MSIASPTNFLEIVQRVSIEVGIAGDPVSTLAGASGEILNLATWANQSWMDLQQKYPNWGFMLRSPGFSFPTTASQTKYTAANMGISLGDVSSWDRETFRVYTTATGDVSEVFMTYVSYKEWRDSYNLGTLRTTERQPTVFSIHPDNGIVLVCPAAGYTVTGDYYQIPTAMALDADIPYGLPTQYYPIIVAGAMEKYAMFESAPEVRGAAQMLGGPLMSRLENTRLTEVTAGGALA